MHGNMNVKYFSIYVCFLPDDDYRMERPKHVVGK